MSNLNYMDAPAIAPSNWSNPPTLNDIKSDIAEGEIAHSPVVSNLIRWENNLKGLLDPAIKIPKDRSSIQPKLIRKQAEWRYSSLEEPFLSNKDIFKADPVTYEDEGTAKQAEILLNYQFNKKLDRVKFINSYVRSAVDKGTVICKVGWEYRDKRITVRKPVYVSYTNTDPAYVRELREALKLYLADPITFKRKQDEATVLAVEQTISSNAPIQVIVDSYEEVEEVKVLANHPTVEVRNPKQVIIDPTCKGDLSKANFIVDEYESSISELKKKGIYKNLEYIKVDQPTSSTLLSSTEDSTFKFKDTARKKIVVREYWGYWDIDGNDTTKPIVVTLVGDVIIRMEDNPFPFEGLPFVVKAYLPIEESSYGEPDGELLEDNQKVVGAITRGMLDIMARTAAGQKGSAKDALDVTNQKKYNRGEDYQFNPTTHPERAFHTHTFPEIPRSAQYLLDLHNADSESLTGVKAFHNGISGGALGNTATGVRSALDATSKRDLEILTRLASGIIEIGRMFMAMNAVFLDEAEIVRITNNEFVSIDKDDLKGDIDISLTISTAETDNTKAEQLAFMMQTLGQTMGLDMVKIVLAEFAELRKMPALAKKIKEYQPQPDPIEQEKRMLELELMKAEIAEKQYKAMDKQSTSILNQTKAGTEQAKQRLMGSQADKVDLDFVEQETGTKQERDLEKQGAQARANMVLATLKEQLKLTK